MARYWELIAEMKEATPDLSRWLKPGNRRVQTDIDMRATEGHAQVVEYCAYALNAPWRVWELPDGSPAIEVHFTLSLGDIEIVGFIDKVHEYPDRSIVPVDLKTGSSYAPPLQLGGYKVALEELFGATVSTGLFWKAKGGGREEAHDLSRYTRDYFYGLIRKLDEGIVREIFLPNPGKDCGMCSVQEHCRELGSSPIFLAG